jgi:riboflavin synthase
MFTGIITAVGRIAQVRDLGASSAHGKQLAIEAPQGYLDDVGLGDSIAINGACMTATAIDAAAGRFGIDISAESLARTAGWTRPARSTWKRPCARRTGWAVTSSPATWMASAA